MQHVFFALTLTPEQVLFALTLTLTLTGIVCPNPNPNPTVIFLCTSDLSDRVYEYVSEFLSIHFGPFAADAPNHQKVNLFDVCNLCTRETYRAHTQVGNTHRETRIGERDMHNKRTQLRLHRHKPCTMFP